MALSEEGASDASDTEDHWRGIQREAAEDGDWDLVNKICTAPVSYGRGRNPTWAPLPYVHLKELCKTAGTPPV